MRMYNIYISLSSNIELSQFFFSFMSYYVYVHVYAQNIASNTSVFKLTKLKHVKTSADRDMFHIKVLLRTTQDKYIFRNTESI